ncbi:hypothetical protein KBB85_03835 [Patescibacteria group bacterium]|nr:hypothetical protein [Patescibacteria group bacterium]
MSFARAIHKAQTEATTHRLATYIRRMSADELSRFLANMSILPENIYADDRETARSYLAQQARVRGVTREYTEEDDDLVVVGDTDPNTKNPVYWVHLIQTSL